MIITEIRPRRHRLSQLFIDGEPAVKVDTETLLRSGLSAGDEIDDMDLKKLIEDSADHRAHEKALYLLEHRAHSKKELAAKIARTEFDREAAMRAAERMEELGLVDDEQYARRLTQELFERKKYGVRRVKQELQHKGIDAALIETVLEEFSPETDENVEKIREHLERKYPAAWEDEKVRRRAIAAMQRYGYKMEDIFAVLKEDSFE
ncbi:MAG: regulatory protein RecX [Clostridia bacterium]|nr:regulatory protein RecX [Clostridia bacterium]